MLYTDTTNQVSRTDGRKYSIFALDSFHISCRIFLKNELYGTISHETKAFFKGTYWEISNWLHKDELTEALLNLSMHEKEAGRLIIGIHLEYFSTCAAVEGTSIPSTTLQRDIHTLFQDRENSGDVVLVGNSKHARITAHKLILIARSTYCRDQLQQLVTKVNTIFGKSKIGIDLSGGLLWEFVRFIYTDDMSL